jgi:LPXTG-site transpeptidase (sortase) family protein
MLNKIKISPVVLIVLGLIFISAGIAGAVLLHSPIPREHQNSRYRFYEKNEPQNLAIEDPGSGFSEIPQNNPNETAHGMLLPGLTFIHDMLHPEYERPRIPDKIEIPAIGLKAPVNVSDYNKTKIEGETFGQWVAPSEFAAGWHPDSALLGQTGNIVINGHHNEFGEVFGELVDLKIGDLIIVFYEGESFTYVVSNRLILPERFQEAAVRLENARWLGRTDDTRLTLVTCWPADSNTHRLIIVARPY